MTEVKAADKENAKAFVRIIDSAYDHSLDSAKINDAGNLAIVYFNRAGEKWTVVFNDNVYTANKF